jgi:phage/plasmid-like protein (TIGR03299 family)
MAHELSIREDGTAEMAYVGDEPWHGLGQKLNPGATIEEWTEAAGLNWHVERAQVEFATSKGILNMPSRNVLYRQDTFKPLSVVSDGYKVVQPAQIMDFFKKLTAKTNSQMETAGSLFEGRVIWALARLGDDVSIMDDKVAPYLMLSTSYDMSTPTVGKLVATRVVCNNTLQLAMGEKGQRQIRIPHSTEFKSEDVRAGLEFSLDAFEAFKQQATKLAIQAFEQSDMDKFLLKLLQPSKGEIDGDVIRKSKGYTAIMGLFQGGQLGSGQDAINKTAWGALNAVTQFIDHVKGKNQSSRLMDAWFAEGGKLKEKALGILSA